MCGCNLAYSLRENLLPASHPFPSNRLCLHAPFAIGGKARWQQVVVIVMVEIMVSLKLHKTMGIES